MDHKHQKLQKEGYHHGNLREALINKALTILAAEGPKGLSVRRIAREVGVSAPSVYHHFKSRIDLLVQLAVYGFQKLTEETMQAIRPTNDPDDKIKIYGLKFVKFCQENPHLYHLMYDLQEVEEALIDSGHGSVLSAHYELMRNLTEERIEKWGYRVSVENLTFATWCAFNGLCQTLSDRRVNNMLHHMTGGQTEVGLDMKLMVADIVSDIFVGRL